MIQSITPVPRQPITPVVRPVPSGLTLSPHKFTQTASGLYIPSAAPLVAAAGLVVAPRSLVDNLSAPNVLAHTRQGYENLARTEGARFADFRIADQLSLIDRIASAERQKNVVDGFLRNRVEHSAPAPRA